MNAGGSKIAVFIPFFEGGLLSTSERVMLRATSIIFEIVRLCSSVL